MSDRIPISLEGVYESLYAGFWLRLGAMLLDVLILLPVWGLVGYINYQYVDSYYYTLVPSLLISFWYGVYLVKRYGGTPGKLLLGITILRIDGNDVTWREAMLRELVTIVFSLGYAALTIFALSLVDRVEYQEIPWRQKQRYLESVAPITFGMYRWLSGAWFWSELIVLLFNARKRALHDFIAGTVIVKTRYIAAIRKTMATVDNTLPAAWRR